MCTDVSRSNKAHILDELLPSSHFLVLPLLQSVVRCMWTRRPPSVIPLWQILLTLSAGIGWKCCMPM